MLSGAGLGLGSGWMLLGVLEDGVGVPEILKRYYKFQKSLHPNFKITYPLSIPPNMPPIPIGGIIPAAEAICMAAAI